MTNPVSGENISLVLQEVQEELDVIKRLLGRFVFPKGDQFIERANQDFGGLLSEGERPGFTVGTTRTVTSGVPGTVCTSQIVVDGTAIIRDMTLKCDGNIAAVVVRASGNCIIEGCHILKDSQQEPGDFYIEVEAGGKLNVVSSMFHGVQVAGFVVGNSLGVVTDVDVTGCVNLTGVLHDNVTVVGEVPN